jgi:VanZ family protein
MAVILMASTNGLSASNTSRVVGPLLLWLFPGISEEKIAFAHFMIRKGAHFTEYGILALLAARAFLSSSQDLLRTGWFPVSFFLVAGYSLLDESFQSLMPARASSFHDSLIDMAGGATALILLTLLRHVAQRKKPVL